jgi:hypothetical protein
VKTSKAMFTGIQGNNYYVTNGITEFNGAATEETTAE